MAPPVPFDPSALRRARRRAGLSQHNLARVIGVAGGERVSAWEAGRQTPRPETLRKLSLALKVPVEHLTGSPDPGLHGLRLAAGLSAAALAEKAHLSTRTIYRLEAGDFTKPPSQATLERLGEALGVPKATVGKALTPRTPPS